MELRERYYATPLVTRGLMTATWVCNTKP